MNRRQILQLGGGLAMLAAAGAGGLGPRSAHAQSGAAEAGDPLAVGEGERVLGDPQAPVTLIDYSSLTCPHCAAFHNETLPQIKQAWVDTGRAKIVYRHFPLDRLALAAAMSAECIVQDKAYFAYLDMLFAEQMQWARAEDPIGELRRRASLAGLAPERFDACVTDQALADRILQKVVVARDALEVASTPTFFVNGEKIAGAQDYEVFDKALQEAEGAA